MDKVSERSKGFGFVTFASEDAAENAITGMNGKVSPKMCLSFCSLSLSAYNLEERTDGSLS